MVDSKLAEEIDACLSFIRHNKVYEKLEEADVEAYNMTETLIETLRDKLEEEIRISTLRGNVIEFELIPNFHDVERKLKDAEKSRDQWRSMWEKEHTENEELKTELLEYTYVPRYTFTGTGMKADKNGGWIWMPNEETK